MDAVNWDPQDTPASRKGRGAFFTPPAIAKFIAEWAIQSGTDTVFEPAAGDAEFLLHATHRLQHLGNSHPHVFGCELHDWSAASGRKRVADAGGCAEIAVGDFFLQELEPEFDAVIGNPPYIRFQEFSGEKRVRAREAALKAGVALSGQASAWAAFTVVAATLLRRGGKLGFVLPAELLSANYAASVRRFIFSNFNDVELVLFEDRVFAEAETETVLLLAGGFGLGSSETAKVRQVRNVDDLCKLPPALQWAPLNPSDKWSDVALKDSTSRNLLDVVSDSVFAPLTSWGKIRLGMVTGRNSYFALSPQAVADADIEKQETLPLSPPGSAHLKGLELSTRALTDLGKKGFKTRLFYPPVNGQSVGAKNYLAEGERLGVDKTYKSRSRKVWYQVPLVPPPDIFLTYMNAETVRLVSNTAKAYHLNSIHGLHLDLSLRELGMRYLPLSTLNSFSLFSAELAGRSYGGGILKMEPGEVNRWLVPSSDSVRAVKEDLHALRPIVGAKLRGGKLAEAVEIIDSEILVNGLGIDNSAVQAARSARNQLASRRKARSRG